MFLREYAIRRPNGFLVDRLRSASSSIFCSIELVMFRSFIGVVLFLGVSNFIQTPLADRRIFIKGAIPGGSPDVAPVFGHDLVLRELPRCSMHY
jgi:hypothetical protein